MVGKKYWYVMYYITYHYWYVMYNITYQYFTLETNSKFASLSRYQLLTVLDFWLTPKAYTVRNVS
jgi:hypothetical protein